MIGKTNIGGGSSLSFKGALVCITAPIESTITLIKNNLTIKTFYPKDQHILSDSDTRANWYYSVSPSNYGEWTVIATRGTDTDSKTIIINSDKQYDVELSYILWFVQNGVLKREPYAFARFEAVPGAEYYTLRQTAGSGGCAAAWLIDSPDIYDTLVFTFVKAGTVIPTGQSDRCGIATAIAPSGSSIETQNATYIVSSTIIPLNDNFETREFLVTGVSKYGNYVKVSVDWGSNLRTIVFKDVYLAKL